TILEQRSSQSLPVGYESWKNDRRTRGRLQAGCQRGGERGKNGGGECCDPERPLHAGAPGICTDEDGNSRQADYATGTEQADSAAVELRLYMRHEDGDQGREDRTQDHASQD